MLTPSHLSHLHFGYRNHQGYPRTFVYMQTASCDSVISPLNFDEVRTLTSEEREVQGFQMHLYLGSSLSSPKNVWFFFKRSTHKKNTPKIYQKINTDFGNIWICLPPKTTEIWASWLVWLRAKSAAFCAFGATFGARWRCPTRGRQSGCEPRKKKLLLSIILVG